MLIPSTLALPEESKLVALPAGLCSVLIRAIMLYIQVCVMGSPPIRQFNFKIPTSCPFRITVFQALNVIHISQYIVVPHLCLSRPVPDGGQRTFLSRLLVWNLVNRLILFCFRL